MGLLTAREKEALAAAAAACSSPPPRSDGRNDLGHPLPIIPDEVVAYVRATPYIEKEERERLGLSRWMVWAIRKGVRRKADARRQTPDAS